MIYNKLIEAPYKPKLKDDLDLSNFDKNITNQNTNFSYTSNTKLNLINSNQFLFNKFEN